MLGDVRIGSPSVVLGTGVCSGEMRVARMRVARMRRGGRCGATRTGCVGIGWRACVGRVFVCTGTRIAAMLR
jgi:hypothetical protein